jgi:hypothetical protein
LKEKEVQELQKPKEENKNKNKEPSDKSDLLTIT